MNDRRDLVAELYPGMATELLNPLLELLDQCRRACDGDLDKFMIVLVIASRTTQHPRFRSLPPDQLLSGDIMVLPSLGTNVRSIAASIAMPRESVRRKVGELMDRGWVVRQGHGLFFTSAAYRQLAPVFDVVERLAVRNFEAMAARGDGSSPRE